MKNIIITLICYIFIAVSNGQGGDGEFFKKRYINADNRDTILVTFFRPLDVTNTSFYNFRFSRVNSKYFVEIQGTDLQAVKSGDSLWIKFEGGFNITLYANENVKLTREECATYPDPSNFSATYCYSVKFNISNSQLMAIAGNLVEKMRVFSTIGFTDIKPRDEERQQFLKYANKIKDKQKYKMKSPKEIDTW